MSERENQQAFPTPSLSAKSSQDASYIPLFEDLFLDGDFISEDGFTMKNEEQNQVMKKPKKTQKINKPCSGRKGSIREGAPKETAQKKIIKLENRIRELQNELAMMERKLEYCPKCSSKLFHEEEKREMNFPPVAYDEEAINIAQSVDSPRGSRGSMEFEKMDFNTISVFNREIDDKGWIFLGTMMIAMGSKCLDVDGTINVFKILKESVDHLRRQVEKSAPSISMDFFICKEEMQENIISEQIGFDPFTEKPVNQGLQLQGLKVESVEEFELIYDSKLTYNIKYQALITAMEYAREGCWMTSS